jgi:hypothetical protein
MTFPVEARRENADERRCEPERACCQDAAHEQHGVEHLLKEAIGASPALDLLDPRPQRHEGRVERALGQQSAEEIGDLQDRKERVGEDARAE